MRPLLGAQFLSALADNALLFGALVLLVKLGYPAWAAPVMQSVFVAAYILLAPFVGAFAEAYAKQRVMQVATGLKLAGAGLFVAGANPFLAYGLVGVGAAIYSPAKYGILPELLPAKDLVKGNGALEASTVVAILLGALIGGAGADWNLTALMVGVGVAYVAALGLTLAIPVMPASRPGALANKRALISQCGQDVKTLWSNASARMSLLGTGVFWGAGATLRLLLVAWVPVALLRTDATTPAMLSAVVAIGIAIGAGIASKRVKLEDSLSVLKVGPVIGMAAMGLAAVSSFGPTIGLLIVLGAAGGYYIVPLNAMLQEAGHASVGAGKAVAVQNLFENVAMLGMLGLYAALSSVGMGPVALVAIFGTALTAGLSILALRKHG